MTWQEGVGGGGVLLALAGVTVLVLRAIYWVVVTHGWFVLGGLSVALGVIGFATALHYED